MSHLSNLKTEFDLSIGCTLMTALSLDSFQNLGSNPLKGLGPCAWAMVPIGCPEPILHNQLPMGKYKSCAGAFYNILYLLSYPIWFIFGYAPVHLKNSPPTTKWANAGSVPAQEDIQMAPHSNTYMAAHALIRELMSQGRLSQ